MERGSGGVKGRAREGGDWRSEGGMGDGMARRMGRNFNEERFL